MKPWNLALAALLVMNTPEATFAENTAFYLHSGTGCEHIVIGTGPDKKPLAITSRTEHRGLRFAKAEGLGFAFIQLNNGHPTLVGTQNPKDFSYATNETERHTWQALDFQESGPLAENGALLAAAPTTSRYEGCSTHPLPCVEFFTWDHSAPAGVLRLKRCLTPSTPPISINAKNNINALSLATNGDVYVSVLSPNIFAQLPSDLGETVVNSPMTPHDRLVANAIYLWRPHSNFWIRVAEKIPAANGVILSPDGKTLAVNSFAANSILLFPRNPMTGLLSKPSQINLGKGHSPDNLSRMPGSRASAMATPGFLSGLALAVGGLTGSQFGIRPSSTIWEINVSNPDIKPKPVMRIPCGRGVFSDATRFGDWWLCGQILGNGIYCVPANLNQITAPSYSTERSPR